MHSLLSPKTPTPVANSMLATLILMLSRLQNRPARSDGKMHANANAAATVTHTCLLRDITSGKFRDGRMDGHVWIVLLYLLQDRSSIIFCWVVKFTALLG
ncbi:hypothetical protein L596_026354 [Steinernema carpocapsae]|uniref:Uncharacterized protein n=1 Tax=Steinernema carpocapsae TaxID=34508 RepID=A0A4U5M137_STECR|nr:hypothetical protein L596_026354 [Steinernema carpocapsae]